MTRSHKASACDATCACPRCAGDFDATDHALRRLDWAMLTARTRPGLSDFWAAAIVVDAFQRGLDRASQSEQALSEFLSASFRASVPIAYLTDVKHTLAIVATGTNETAVVTLLMPPDWFVAAAARMECCPKGPPHVQAKPAKDAATPGMPTGTKNTAGGNMMVWDVTVTAEWYQDATRCACSCCEFRVFVAFSISVSNPGGAEKTVTDSSSLAAGAGVGGYHKAESGSPAESQADDPRATHSSEGRIFVEDVTFESDERAGINPLEIAEEPEKYAEAELTMEPRPGDTKHDPDSTSIRGECGVEWKDTPRIPLKAGKTTTVALTYLAIIRPTGACGGTSAWTLYTLTGTATDVGRVPTIEEGDPVAARILRTG